MKATIVSWVVSTWQLAWWICDCPSNVALPTLTLPTGGQMCTLDWPLWASTCPSPTSRKLWGIPWLLSSQGPPPVIRALSCLCSRQSSWSTLDIPVGPTKEDAERAPMTFPSLTTGYTNFVFSAIHLCWPSSGRKGYSSVPLKTSERCSELCWVSTTPLHQNVPFVCSSKSNHNNKKMAVIIEYWVKTLQMGPFRIEEVRLKVETSLNLVYFVLAVSVAGCSFTKLICPFSAQSNVFTGIEDCILSKAAFSCCQLSFLAKQSHGFIWRLGRYLSV